MLAPAVFIVSVARSMHVNLLLLIISQYLQLSKANAGTSKGPIDPGQVGGLVV